MTHGFPTYSTAASRGDLGVRIVNEVLAGSFGWIFRRNHQEHDFGIDAQTEVVTAEGFVTGQLAALQIKCGRSFFQEKNRWGYIYRGAMKHLNYLANYPIPVFIVLCDDRTGRCYWALFDIEQTTGSESSWKIAVPFDNVLSETKDQLLAHLPMVVDAKSELESYWAASELLHVFDPVVFIVGKDDVEALNVRPLREFFDRLLVSKELAAHCQGKVDIWFHGYDDDPRELFEVPEVRAYIARAHAILPELFFFASIDPSAAVLKTFAFCLSDVSWGGPPVGPRGRRLVNYPTQDKARFLTAGFEGLNHVLEWLRYSNDENREISDGICRYFGILAEEV